MTKEKEHKIGDIGPGGGIIFYDKGEFFDGWRFLEAAPADLITTCGWMHYATTFDYDHLTVVEDSLDYYLAGYAFGLLWNVKNEMCVVGTDTSIGSGKANTIKIISAIGDDYIVYGVETPEVAIRDYNYAAKACSFANKECIHTRIHDWFLPSKDELNLMYEFFKNKTFGSFEKEWYWSSSEKDEEKAWQQNFRTGEQSVCRRTAISRVRPIRAF